MTALPVLLLMLLETAFVSGHSSSHEPQLQDTFKTSTIEMAGSLLDRTLRSVDFKALEENRVQQVLAGNSTIVQAAGSWSEAPKAITRAATEHASVAVSQQSAFRRSIAVKSNVPSLVQPSTANNSVDYQTSWLKDLSWNTSSFLEAAEKLLRHAGDFHQTNITALGQSGKGDGTTSQALGNDTSPGLLPRGLRSFSISSLPYLFQSPYLTVHTNDFETDDKVSLYISASFEQDMSCKWFLNGHPLEEYDVVQTNDIGSYQVDNRTFLKRVCHMEIEHLFKLPTHTGKYEFGCIVTMDSSKMMINHMLSPLLTDSCPPANCYIRNALCKKGSCVCGGAYPVKVHSVHITCRAAASLERSCHYDQQCLHTAGNSECIEEGRCACKRGFGRTQNNQCTKKVGVNARCETDKDCLLFNASCILSHCSCNSNDIEDNNRCIDVGLWTDYSQHIHSGDAVPGLSTEVVLIALAFVARLSKP